MEDSIMSCRGEENIRLTHRLKICPFCGAEFTEAMNDPKRCPQCGDFCYISKVLCHWNGRKLKWIPVKNPDWRIA